MDQYFSRYSILEIYVTPIDNTGERHRLQKFTVTKQQQDEVCFHIKQRIPITE